MHKKHRYTLVITIAIISVCIAMPKVISMVKNARRAFLRSECYSNLKILGDTLEMNADELAGELKGTYPAMSSEANRLMFTTEGFLPKYIPAPELLVCSCQVAKGIPPAFDDTSYFYTGYALVDHGDPLTLRDRKFGGDIMTPKVYSPFDNLMSDFSDIYMKQIASGGEFKERFVREGEIDICRLSEVLIGWHYAILDCVDDDTLEGITISIGSIPVLIEWPDNHISKGLGGHVLWRDGHVRWIEYPGEFPMTEEAMAIFTELAGRPPIGQLE